MDNDMELIYFGVAGWNWDEIETMYPWLKAYANVLGDKRKAQNCLKVALLFQYGEPVTTIEQCLKTVIKLIFHELVGTIKKYDAYHDNAKLKANLTQLEKSFSPSVGHNGSYIFGNCFDKINFEQERDLIIIQAVELVKSI